MFPVQRSAQPRTYEQPRNRPRKRSATEDDLRGGEKAAVKASKTTAYSTPNALPPLSPIWRTLAAAPPAWFRLTLQTLIGEKFQFALPPGSTVAHVKDEGRALHGWPADRQRLIYAGKQLEDGRLLAHYLTTPTATLYLVGPLD